MLFVAALLPVVIYIFVVYKIDNFSLISIKNLFLQVLCGWWRHWPVSACSN